GSAPLREIVRRMLAGARAWAAVTTFAGREVIRICATHGQSSLADVEVLVEELDAATKAV
ncbi:MAG: hypothetical protein ACREU2_05120, partial [Steroidobacteraceae bacterium]